MRFANENSYLGPPTYDDNNGRSSQGSSFNSNSPNNRTLKPNANIAPIVKSYSPPPIIDIDEMNIF
jgi:hypothetical protein